MLLLVIGFSWYTAPSPEQVAEQVRQDSLARVESARMQRQADSLQQASMAASAAISAPNMDSATVAAARQQLASRYGVLGGATVGQEQTVELRNNKWALTFSTKGGMLVSATLLDGYTRYSDKAPVTLWADELSKMHLQLPLIQGGLTGSDAFYFQPSAIRVDATQAAAQLVMRLVSDDPSKQIELIYSAEPNSYALQCQINVNGLGDQLNGPLKLQWDVAGITNEKGIQAERTKTSVFFREMDEDRDYLSESGSHFDAPEKAVNWMAFKQDYFSAAVVSAQGFNQAQLSVTTPAETDSVHTKFMAANLGLPIPAGASGNAQVTFFFGPNDYKVLESLQVAEFDKIIDYGWGIIGWVNKYCVRPLFWFFSSFIGSFGLIILIVTLIIKMVLFPVTWKNFLSSAKMRVLRPEMDEINKKYEGKDAVEKQQAVMALYRQTGVNPFAGCIPVLIQMPILYAMFRFFPAEIVLRGQSFLWADDLAAYDSILDLGFNIPFYGSHVSGFTLLMCVSTFVYTRMSMGAQPQMAQQPGMPNMTVMMNIFTFMMLFFFNSMPSGLSMYYFVANMISIGQMWVIKNYIIDEKAIRAKIEENKKKPVKKSSFAQRLEQMQKEQQKRLDQQKAKLKK